MAQDDTLAQLKKALTAIKELRGRLDAVERARTEPIAIIGMGCRFPGGVNSPDEFWTLLANGVDAIRETPPDRWDVDALYDPNPEVSGGITSRYGGYLDRIDQFDPYFFGIAPKEAALMDPQQRLLLQVAWEALENAGQTRESLMGSLTGVFVGMHSHSIDYYLMQTQSLDEIDVYTGTGTSHSVTGGRLSYLFDLRGPNVSLDTACSSSLVAVHLAVQSLRNGESNMAVAGGVNLILSPEFTVAASRMHMLAPDGRCKTFDQRADGFVRGEGCGVVILKRLSDALNDGDPIHAVIRGSAVNQDGKTNGLTAPNGLSQQAVIQAALANAGVDKSEISYIEAHGTGTSLGDPIEVEALGAVLGGNGANEQDCYLGSAKSNIGHLEGAAGVAGLIKVVMSMRHEAIPPLLHFTGLNPHISFDDTPFRITTDLIPWAGEKRLAGVSSFGWSGTNAHVIVESAPATPDEAPLQTDKAVLLPLSAQSPEALAQLSQSYRAFLAGEEARHLHLNHIGYTAGARRTHFDYRMAVVGQSQAEMAERLSAFLGGEQPNGVVFNANPVSTPRKIMFVFPGQGGQWVGMGRQLLEREPVFRAAMERCESAIAPHVNWSLLAELASGARLDEIDVIQPMLFAIQVSLAELWHSWGIEADGIIGHSMGEVAGAHVAGILSLEDAAHVICRRSQLMKRVSGKGAMAVVGLSHEQAQAALNESGQADRVGIAVNNAPHSTVLSGDPEPLEAVLELLRAQNVFCRPVKVDVAAHSPQMEALRPELVNDLRGLQAADANVPIYSTVTGGRHEGTAFDTRYWGDNLRQPVLFAAGVQAALADGFNTFIEIGPHPVLLNAVEQNMQAANLRDGITLASMRREENEQAVMLEALGGLYAAGREVDWTRLYPDGGRVVPLPSYAWQEGRFWIEPKANTGRQVAAGGNPLIGARLPELAHMPSIHVWENLADNRFTRYMDKHFGGVVDEAVYQAMAVAAADEIYESRGQQVTELTVHAPLPVSSPGRLALQIVLETGETTQFRIFGREANNSTPWTEYVSGQIQQGQVETGWLYELQWQPQEREAASPALQTGDWLIFADQSGVGEALAARLAEAGIDSTLVYAGDSYNSHNGSYVVNPTQPDDFKRLFVEVEPSRAIIYLWALDLPETANLSPGDIPDLQVLSGESVLYTIQSVAPLGWETQLWLVTRGAANGLQTMPVPGVAQSPLWGLGRSIALEHPDYWGGLIDLTIPANPAQDALRLLAEANQPGAEDQIAYQDGNRYVARLVQSPDRAQANPFEWRADATYLITGGLRGVGLRFAETLVEQGARNLVLMGRSGASESAQAVLARLEAFGVQIKVARADVSNYEDIAGVMADIQETMPPLRGVIHSAAVLDDGMLQGQDRERFNRVMSPKIAGTWNLHLLTKDLPLDCFVVFSSFAALPGTAGQGNYAAANAFMDALMHYRQGLGLAGLSINWGAWGEIGLAAGMGETFSRLGLQLMNPEQAVATLPYLVRTGIPQSLVTAVDWSVFKPNYVTKRRRPLLDLIGGEAASTEVGEANFRERLEATAAEQRFDLILNEVRDEAAQVLGFSPPQALDLRRGFFTLGMDSLMSVRLRNRLESRFSCTLAPTIALEYPTVESLSEYIAEHVFKLDVRKVETASPQAAAEPSPDFNGLEDNDLLDLLNDELASINKLIGDD